MVCNKCFQPILIIPVQLIEFENCTLYNTRTPTYFANLNRTQTQKQARHQGTLIWNNLPTKELMSYMNFYDTYFLNDFCITISFCIVFIKYIFAIVYVCSVCVYCVCLYVSVPPMSKSGYADHCDVKHSPINHQLSQLYIGTCPSYREYLQ